MKELLSNAVGGWKQLIGDGKWMVLFLGALLYCWYGVLKKSGREVLAQQALARQMFPGRGFPGDGLLRYAAVSLLLVAFPPTAALLLLYQTRFYDPVWLASFLPVTVMTAYGAARALTESYERFGKKSTWRALGLGTAAVLLFLMCAGAGVGFEGDVQEMQDAQEVLDHLEEDRNAEDLFLWAPADLLRDVRALDGSVTLLYGRDMWEDALKAHSYEEYLPEVVACYRWMEQSCAWLKGESDEGFDEEALQPCVVAALGQGVNCILLPQGMRGEELSKALEGAIVEGGYSVKRGQAPGYDCYWVGPRAERA